MIRKLYILFTFLAFSGCYDDFDGSSKHVEKEISTTTMETGITGKIITYGIEDIASFELMMDGQTLVSGQNIFYSYLDVATKKGQIFELFRDNRLVGIANPLLIENDINYIEISSFSGTRSFSYSPSNALTTNMSTGVDLELGASAFIGQDNAVVKSDLLIDYTVTNDVEIINQLGNLAYDGENEVMLYNSTLLFINASTKNTKVRNQKESSHIVIKGSKYNGKSIFHLNQFGQITLVHDNITGDDKIAVSDLGVFIISDYQIGVYTEGTMVKESNRVSYMSFLSEEKKYYSTAHGRWASLFPINSNVELNILTPCLDVLESKNLETQESESQYAILINDDLDLIYNIKTKVINCEGEIEDVQAINVSSEDNSFVYVFNDAEIDTWIPICKNEFDISGTDKTLQQNGPQFSWSIDISDELTIVSSCESFENGFGYVVINGEEHAYDSFDVEPGMEMTSLKSSTQSLRLHFDGSIEREYTEKEVRIFIEEPDLGDNGYAISCENSELGCGIESFNVTHFDDSNEGWLRVSFSGVLWAQTINPPVAGNYPISGVILSKINK